MSFFPQPPNEGDAGALANWAALNAMEQAFRGYKPSDFLNIVAGGIIDGGAAPYNLSPSASGVVNRTALLTLIADCQTAGKSGFIPSFIVSGTPKFIPLAPIQIPLDGDREVVLFGLPHCSGFQQVADPATTLAYIAATPSSGFAHDKNGATPPDQNYWIFADGETSSGSIQWHGLTFQGGHGSVNAPSDPNGASEASWLTWGIGMRVPRRAQLWNTKHGGSWAGIQFDGDYDHTHCQNVESSGNWDNVRFGPRQNEKDNVFVNCLFANSSNAGIAVAPTGFLGGSSWFAGHLGTQPYGIYFESGAKSSSIGIQLQNMNFSELIWEGVGNFKIFCEDGDSRLDNIAFNMVQWHGIEVGDYSNVHMKFHTQISNLARASTGIVTVTVQSFGGQPVLGGITAGQYVNLNGVGNQPVEGIKVGGGSADTSLLTAYRVLTASGTTITMQGTPTGVIASGAVPTTGAAGSGSAYLARVGAVRAGKLTGWRGNLQITGDELDARDRATFAVGTSWGVGGYGTAAELFFDIVSLDDCEMYDSNYLPNFGPRLTYHLTGQSPSFWRSSGGHFYLAATLGAIAAKSVVQFKASSNVGDIEQAAGNREAIGIVGGTSAYTHPTSPAGDYVFSGDYTWVQDRGWCEVLGSGTSPQVGSIAAVGGNTAVADASGQVKVLAAGTSTGTSDFKIGKAVGTASAGTCVIKVA